MGLVDRFKNFVNPSAIDDEYDDAGYEEYENDENGDYGTGYEDDYAQQTQQTQRIRRPIPNAPQRSQDNYDYQADESGSNVEMKKIAVEKWEDVKVITQHLIKHRIILIDISGVQTDLARRMLDFIYGVVYVINGKLQKVDTKTWLATPSNVNYTIDKNPNKRPRPSVDSAFIDSDEII